MAVGLKQTKVRDENLKLSLDLLRVHSLSSSELAKILHLSKQALSKITTDLIDLNLIKVTENGNYPNKRGRKKVNYCINEEVGLLATITFYSVTCEVTISNAAGKVLQSSLLTDCEQLTPEHLEMIVNMLNELLDRFDLPLLYIVIAVPGEVNRYDSSINLATKFEACEGINLVEYYSSRFNCKVNIKNDINLMMLGERTYGDLKKVKNALMLYIDSGVGGSICYEGNIIEGDTGYAAEFGLIKVYKGDSIVNIEQLFSINFIKKMISNHEDFSSLGIPANFRYRDIVRLYNEGNPIVRSVILKSCLHVAILIENLYYIFEIKNVRISGRITMLGNDYLSEIKKHLGSLNDKIVVDYSSLGIKGIELGAIKFGLDKAFDDIIENRTLKNHTIKCK